MSSATSPVGSAVCPAKNVTAEPLPRNHESTQSKGTLMVSTLTEFARLASQRPAPDAQIEVVAARYAGKARLHLRLAGEASTADETAHELDHATAALRRADRLRAAVPVAGVVMGVAA